MNALFYYALGSREDVLLCRLPFILQFASEAKEDEGVIDSGLTLVYAPNQFGRTFLRRLISEGVPVAALVNSERQKRVLEGYGITQFVRLNTRMENCPLQRGAVQHVYLFDESMPLTCRFLRAFRPLVPGRIVIIRNMSSIPGLYRHLGADTMVNATEGELDMLIEEIEKIR
ncbi:hypothetical protein [Paenibacillus turpanensis]|uniref:hypothetical protein n=1 Tax=Paenibacillus turpanensis TaxID=2689078 RepID=UPI00140BD500|nr:hypothetical protein [Paenibacillus turpanensis]